MRARDFSGSVGVVTHSTYYDTAYGANGGQNILPDLNYLGVTQIRDGLDVVAKGGLIEQLMAAGIKDDMVAGTFGNGVPAETVAAYIANLKQFEADRPGGVTAVEGFNEVTAANLPATKAFQAQLYAAIKADPKLSGISLYNYTGSSFDAGFYTAQGNVSSAANFGNTHSYTEYFPPELWNSWFVPLGLTNTPGLPYVVTETGFDTSSLPADVAAKETLNDVFDLIHDGASKAYLYELLDEKPDPTMLDYQQHFGLFNYDGTPKPTAVALHNLNTILADPGITATTFTAGSLAYSISGLSSAPLDRAALQAAFGYGIFQSTIANLPAYGNSLLLAKSDGSFDLAVWREPMIYDGVNRIAAPLNTVTITLGQVAGSVEVFDPLVGTSPVATYGQVSQVTLQVSDHPLIVEIDPLLLPLPTSAKPVVAGIIPTVIGAGPDVLALSVSEDAYLGDAQFTISVDGVQVGGVQTATALHGVASQPFNVAGAFGAGRHVATVNFLNDAYDGSPTFDRNLYVASALINGAPVAGAVLTELSAGPQQFSFGATAPVVMLGAGADVLALSVSEDAYLGDAQFTISVDGLQVGGVQTATALYGAASQTYDVAGSFDAGHHVATINFLNDAYGGSPNADRNLYVASALINGAPIAGAALTEMSEGPQQFSFGAVTPVVTLGAGQDVLALSVSEDAYLGDAQFTISVDGIQVGGVQTATALNGAASQTFNVAGAFGAARHVAMVNFLNDAYGGSPNADRNLYVTSASMNGAPIANVALTEMSAGPQQFSFGTALAIGFIDPAMTLLTVHLAEDAWQGDAAYAVTIDGKPVASGTVTALNSKGQSQNVSLQDLLSAGVHNVDISFLNDAYGGSPAADRNLYVKGLDVNAVTQAGSAATMLSTSTSHFQILLASQ